MGAEPPQGSPKATTETHLDSPFERLTALACAMFDTPHAMVGVIRGDMTLFHANVGLRQTEMKRDLTATNLLVGMGAGAVLVVEDALKDERVRNHPMVTGEPGLRFFAGACFSNTAGEPVGAIGVMDVKPRTRPSETEIEGLKILARMAGEIIDQVEVAHRQSEQLKLLKLAEEMASIGHWRLDAESLRSTWSDQVYRIYGVTRETFDPNLDDSLTFFHVEDRDRVRQAVMTGLATGEGFRIRARFVRADGEERIVEAHADTERDSRGEVISMFGVFQDVTDEDEALQKLTDSERRYRLLASRVTDIIVTYGVDGLVTYVSPSLEAVTGIAPEALIGRPATTLIHPDDIPALTQSFREFVKAPPEWSQRGVTYRGLPGDGDEVRWFEARTSIIRDENGRVVEFQDLVRDVTETKRLEQELTEARDRAEAGAQAKSEFLANMSHELRTPLTSVIGFSGLLQQSAALPEAERRYADRIAIASEALLGVINDILDYSKLEANAVSLDPRPFDPAVVVQAAAAMVEGVCAARGLSMTVEIAPDMPPALTGDEGRLRQVMLNFLSNAAKFTSEGGVRLEAVWCDGRLRVAVSDTGIGVPADKIDALFERFSQADNSTTRLYGGTGLGLSISRRLIEMMGGEIGAASEPGRGSTFWFEVPLIQAEAAWNTRDAAEAPSPEGLRILMADDAAANRELVSAILGSMGVALETVTDGAEAVEAARAGLYDLILMDVHMPVMDGLDATRAIRGFEGPAGQVPIIALTANVQPDQVRRCREAGMDDHVGKPVQVDELLRVMAARLAQRAAGSGGVVAA